MRFNNVLLASMLMNAVVDGGAGGAAPTSTPPTATPPTNQPPTATPPTAEPPKPASIDPTPPAPKVADSTGDAVLDYAVSFIEGAGISTDSPAFVAAINGDFSLLQVEFMQKGTQGGEKIVAILEQKFKEQQAKQVAQTEATNKLIYEAVGGEENWKAIQTWAKANAEPDEINAVNAAFKQGGHLAKMMAHYLALQYGNTNGSANQGVPVTRQEASNVKPTNTGKLTRAEYTEAVTALRAKVGYNIDNHPEYLALRARLGR